MKQVLGIKDEAARMKVPPPVASSLIITVSSEFYAFHSPSKQAKSGPLNGWRRTMEPERRRHQFQPLRALRARAPLQAGPGNTTQESSRFLFARLLRRQCNNHVQQQQSAVRARWPASAGTTASGAREVMY